MNNHYNPSEIYLFYFCSCAFTFGVYSVYSGCCKFGMLQPALWTGCVNCPWHFVDYIVECWSGYKGFLLDLIPEMMGIISETNLYWSHSN